jgi:hypothetical protein
MNELEKEKQAILQPFHLLSQFSNQKASDTFAKEKRYKIYLLAAA